MAAIEGPKILEDLNEDNECLSALKKNILFDFFVFLKKLPVKFF